MIQKDSNVVILKEVMHDNLNDKTNISVKKFSELVRNRTSVKGFAEVYLQEDNDIELIGKQNLIVYDGREVTLCRMLNATNTNISPNYEYKNYFISWLSIGTGGATTDPLVPKYPELDNTELDQEIVLDFNNTNYCDSGKKKPIGQIEFLQDDANDNRYLVAKITTTINKDEGNTNNINEAALWLSSSTNANDITNSNMLKIFSRVCFSTIEKNANREIILVWYLFF